jgi:hypothetical protein
MRKILIVLLLALPAFGQGKRLWVLRAPGEMAEYDPVTFALKQRIKVPADAVSAPENLSVNRLGQILFAPAISIPLAESDAASPHKVWFWNGQSAVTLDLGAKREVVATGSNHAITESAPSVYLSSDGAHLFWFANEARRLVRDEVDLSTATEWDMWQTDLAGNSRQDLVSMKLPECRCTSGVCEETCPYGGVWAPDHGLDSLVFMTQSIASGTGTVYKQTSLCQQNAAKWTCTALPDPIPRVLDATADGSTIVEAIPDTGCCGWSNASDDQTIVRNLAKPEAPKRVVFDEFKTYKNSDYDVSFYTANARLSPDLQSLSMTIVATTDANKPIQLSEQGETNPEESKAIRKALADLPAVEIKSLDETLRRVAFLPHATLIGWISNDEVLLIENHVLAAYNVTTGARRKTAIEADDAAHVFLR